MSTTPLTRRAFARGAAAAAIVPRTLASAILPATLGAAGCGGKKDPIAAKLPDKPVRAGEVVHYLKRGVYNDLKAHNIWLYSDGTYLMALAAVCTHNFCVVKYDSMIGQYTCPCHHSRFTEEGLVKQGSKARVSLQRCGIRRVRVGDTDIVEVDPTRRFREEEKEWGLRQSLLLLVPPPDKDAAPGGRRS